MTEFKGTGRRKTAIARVRVVSPGTGKFNVNDKPVEEYFPVDLLQREVYKPLSVLDLKGSVDIFVRATGGGYTGQAGAVQLGVARALVVMQQDNKESLRPAGVLTRDPRMVERKKYGRKKARKRFQFSKR